MQNYSEQEILQVNSFGIKVVSQWLPNSQSIMNIVWYIVRIAQLF